MKPRVLLLSAVVPVTSSGGRFALHRHFVEQRDFEVAVASLDPAGSTAERRFPIPLSPAVARLSRTRLARLAWNYQHLQSWWRVPPALVRFATEFSPDVVFTVPDNQHAGWALGLAQRLHVPLVVDFQDLFPLSRFLTPSHRPLPGMRAWLMAGFRRLNRRSDVAFYTSEGMRDWFGGHPNGHVLYPVGHFEKPVLPEPPPPRGLPIEVVYAGNCYGAYGRMLLALAQQVKRGDQIRLRIFAAGNDWPAAVRDEMVAAGIYCGFRPFAQLKTDLARADAFLTVMSFEPEETPFVRTSFTTKWLDYAPYGKPVFVWAPAHSTAAQFARQHGCGIVLEEPDAAAACRRMHAAANQPAAWQACGQAARRVSESVLDAGRIHALLVQELSKVAARSRAQAGRPAGAPADAG
jgi:hypothetical protein